MRSIRSLVILGSLVGLVPAVQAQDAPAAAAGGSLFAVLAGGDAGGTGATSSRFAWAPDSTMAVRISQALVAGSDPMSAGWVKLALGGQPRSITPGMFDPAAVYDLRDASLTIYGGNTPATWTSPIDGSVISFPAPGSIPPVKHDDAAAINFPVDDLPILGIEVKVPTDGGFGEAKVTLANPDGSIYASRTVTFPDGGWWAFKLDGPALDDPVEDPDDEDPPTTTDSPEPATLLMAALGAMGLAGWRGRRLVSGVSKKRR